MSKALVLRASRGTSPAIGVDGTVPLDFKAISAPQPLAAVPTVDTAAR